MCPTALPLSRHGNRCGCRDGQRERACEEVTLWFRPQPVASFGEVRAGDESLLSPRAAGPKADGLSAGVQADRGRSGDERVIHVRVQYARLKFTAAGLGREKAALHLPKQPKRGRARGYSAGGETHLAVVEIAGERRVAGAPPAAAARPDYSPNSAAELRWWCAATRGA